METQRVVREAPASLAQQQLWLAEQLDGGRGAFNDWVCLRLHGDLDLRALRWAFEEVVQRHQVMRTVFCSTEETLVQQILERSDLDFEVIAPVGGRADDLLDAARAAAFTPFRLAEHPPVRVRAGKLPDGSHLLLVVLHHIASDLESLAIVLREASQLYLASQLGHAADLAEPTLQYADIALREQDRMARGELDRLASYWAARLRDADPVIALPGRRDLASRGNGGSYDIEIPATLADTIRAATRDMRVSMFAALLGAFRLFVWRLTGQRDVVLGTPCTQRLEARLSDMVGPFFHLIALRNPVAEPDTFADVATRERAGVLGGLAHAGLPYGALAGCLPGEAGLSLPRLQVLLICDEGQPQPATLGGLRTSALDLGETRTQFDLTVKIAARPDGPMDMRWMYGPSLEAASVREFAAGFRAILAAAAGDTAARVDTLPVPFAGPVKPAISPTGLPAARPSRRPQGETEHRVALLWAEALKIASVDDASQSIFSLGAQSLTVARLAARMSTEFGVEINLAELFVHPTIAEQAELLDVALIQELTGEGI